MAIEETFELDLSPALGSLAAFSSAIDDVVGNLRDGLIEALGVLSSPPALEVDVDAAAITDSVEGAVSDASSTVEVTGDASDVTTSIDTAVTDADSTVTIDADTSGAQAQVAALGESVSETGGKSTTAVQGVQEAVGSFADSLKDVGGQAKGLPGVLGTAGSAASSLGGAIGKLGELATGPVGVVAASITAVGLASTAALGAVVGLANGAEAASTSLQSMVSSFTGFISAIPVLGSVFDAVTSPITGFLGVIDQSVQAAARAEQATRRLGNTFGQFAQNFNTLEFGGFSISLQDLTTQLGLSGSEAKVAASRFGTLMSSLGPEQAEKASEQFILLSASTIATGRSTDSLADTSLKLQRAIQTGSTRSLLNYGIALDTSKVQTEANVAANTLFGESFTALSEAQQQTALRQARLNVLTAQQGDIQENIARGAQDPTIAFNALQATIKRTFVEIGRPLIVPVLDTLRAGQPVFVEAVQALGQLGRIAVPLIGAAFRAVVPIVTGFIGVLADVAEGVGLFIRGISVIEENINTLSNAVGLGDLIPQSTIQATQQLSGTMLQAAASTQTLSTSQQDAADSSAEQEKATDQLTSAIGAYVSATESRASAAQGVVDAEQEVVDRSRAVGTAAKGVADAQRGVADAHKAVGEAQKGVTRAERDLTDANKSYQQSLAAVQDAEASRLDTIHSLTQAQDELLQAQNALKQAQQGPTEENSINLESAKIALEEAKARQALVASDEHQDAPDTQLALRKADLDVRRAQLELHKQEQAQAESVASAAKDVVSAQSRVVDAQKSVVQSDKALISAHEKVNDAQQSIVDKREAIVTAQDAVTQARQREADAFARVSDAAVGVGKAEADLEASRKKIDEARKKVADADLEALAKRRDLAKQLAQNPEVETQTIARFDTAKQQFPEDAGAIEARKQEFIKSVAEAKASPEYQQALTELGAEGGNLAGDAAKKGIQDGTAGAGTAVATQFKGEVNDGVGSSSIDFGGVIENFKTGLGVIGGTITNGVSTFKDNLIGWVGTAASEAPGRLSDLALNFAIGVGELAGTIVRGTLNFKDDVLGWIGTAARETGGRMFELLTSFRIGLSVIGGAISTGVSGFKDNVLGWIGTAVTEAPGRLFELTKTFVSFATGLPGAVTSALGDTGRFLFEKGKDIIKGLLGGIIDVVNKLPDFLGPLKDKFVDGFRDAFDSHSPARVMIPIGKDIGDGMILGIQGMDIVSVAEGIAREAATAGLTAAAGVANPNAVIAGGGTAVAAGGDINIAQLTVPVTVPAGADPAAVGAAAATAIGDRLSAIRAEVFSA